MTPDAKSPPETGLAGIEIRERVFPQNGATAVGNGHQQQLTSALGTTHGRLDERFGLRLPGQLVTPAEVKPDQHSHPVQRQVVVGTEEPVVADPLHVAGQRAPQEAPHELVAVDFPRTGCLGPRWRVGIRTWVSLTDWMRLLLMATR